MSTHHPAPSRRQLLLAGRALVWSPLVSAQASPVVDWPVVHLLDGRSLNPASWREQPSVVVFWATWCAYCKRHNAHVEALYRANGGQLRVLGVALDRDPGAVRQTMARNGWSFPVALDDGSLRARLTPRQVIPMTCLIDRQGRLLQAIPGEMAADDVLGLARQLQRTA
jgi:thiol-disulfide isomerase/thioredoxin